MTNDERTIRQRLPQATDQQHAALSLLCVGRVLAVVEYFFGNPLRAPEVERLLRTAIAGAPADLELAAELRDSYESKIGELYDEDEQGFPFYAIKVLCGALSRLAPRAWDTPNDVAFDLATLVESLEGEPSRDQEIAWLAQNLLQISAGPVRSLAAVEAMQATPLWLANFARTHRRSHP